MRAFSLLLLGCSSVFSTEDDGSCTVDGDISIERAVWRPSCNGAAHSAECGMAYGVDKGCDRPYLRTGSRCRLRPDGLKGCSAIGAVLCCR